MVASLQKTISEIALQPTTTHNNVIMPDDPIPISVGEQMNSIVVEEVNEEIEYTNITINNVVISSRPFDHYINATQLCQAGGKLFKDWLDLSSTKELMDDLVDNRQILRRGLVQTKQGQSWIYPDLSIQLAQWISPKFAMQITRWVRSLFNEGSM